jgi:hypothetical protein
VIAVADGGGNCERRFPGLPQVAVRWFRGGGFGFSLMTSERPAWLEQESSLTKIVKVAVFSVIVVVLA